MNKEALIFLLVTLFVATQGQQICRALALGGGGDRGAYEAGAVAAFVDAKQAMYNVVTGISAGSINAMGFSQYKIGQEEAAKQYLLDRWKTIKRDGTCQILLIYSQDVYVNWVPGSILEGFLVKSGLFDTTPLRHYLEKHLNLTALRQTDRVVHIGATNIISMTYDSFNATSPRVIDGIMASSAIPGLFPTITLDKQHVYVDGGANYMTPVSSAIERCKHLMPNAQINIDVVLAFGDTQYPALLDIMTTPFVFTRTIWDVVNNIFVKDIQTARLAYPDAKIRVVKPTKFLPSIGLFFDKCQEMIDMGYQDAVHIIEQSQ